MELFSHNYPRIVHQMLLDLVDGCEGGAIALVAYGVCPCPNVYGTADGNAVSQSQ